LLLFWCLLSSWDIFSVKLFVLGTFPLDWF
jgi:hypothetical protein